MTVGALAGTGGISLFGTGGGTPIQAELNVLSAAPGPLGFNLSASEHRLSWNIPAARSHDRVRRHPHLVDRPRADRRRRHTRIEQRVTGLTENDTLKVLYGEVVAIAVNLTNIRSIDLRR